MAIHLKNVHISGAKVGIKSTGPVDLIAENVTFDNVQQPYDIAGVKTAHIRGSRITNDPKPVAEHRAGASVGWRKPNGPPLPVFCPNCKSIFPSRNYNLGGAYFNAWDNEESCTQCGFEHAKLSEGVFDLANETVRVLSAPDITYAMLMAIRRIAEDVALGKIDAHAATKKLDAVSPKLGALARKAAAFGFNAAMLFLTVVTVLYAKEQTALSREQLKLAAEQLALQK